MPPPVARPARFDAQGNPIPEAPAPRRPRQMRPAEERLQDPNLGVRRQAAEEVQSRPQRFDAAGNPVQPNVPMATAPSRAIPQRQAVVRELPEPEGPWYRQAATHVGRFLSGEGQREEDAGEIGWQAIPEQEDVQWEGGLLSPALNAMPRPVRTWLDAEGRTAAVGAGFFLDPNEQHRAMIIQRQVPSAQFRRDEYGNLQARFDESRPWAYINRPGASGEDAITMAGEIEKYLLVRRAMPGGGRAPTGAASPLLASTGREAATGGLSMALSQTAAIPLGGPGPDPVDVAVSTAGAGVGNVVGHSIVRTPAATRATIDWIADRLPGGAQRVAERQAAAQELIAGMEEAARRNAAETVRANAQTANLAGEALERAIRQAEDGAVQVVREQAAGGGREIDQLARTFGVRLAKSQSEGDIGGMQFLYEAAGGLHGPGAQRAAVAFFAEQNRALPEGIRAIVPNPAGVASPEAGVNVARAGAERAFDTARGAERQAWEGFESAVRNVRTYDQTPMIAGDDGTVTGGNPGGVRRVRDAIVELLEQNRIFMVPRTQSEAAQGVADAMRQSYPLVHRALSMVDNLAPATRNDVPLRDVERVLQIKRFIDDLWDSSADNPAQRRILSQMGSTVRDWLRTEGARSLKDRGATVTAQRLEEALGQSRELNRIFRDNRIVRSIVEPPPNTPPPTDEEVLRSLFGGGRGGLNVGSDGVQALRAMREALGPRSPEWESVRQAAVQRLTQGLDTAVETNQTPAIITTYNRFSDAFRANREAMELLFTPDELTRLRQAQQILRSMMPTPRNPANPTNSGITAGRATKAGLAAIADTLRGIPGLNIIVGGAQDIGAAARVNVEIAGAPSESGSRIARALGNLWRVDRNVGGASGAVGSALETTDAAGDRSRAGYAMDGGESEPPIDPSPRRLGEQGITIDPTRPALENADGSFSTEETITIESDGRYYIIPTIMNGRRLSPEQAEDAWFAGANRAVDERSFETLSDANAYAQWRSSQIPAERRRLGVPTPGSSAPARRLSERPLEEYSNEELEAIAAGAN